MNISILLLFSFCLLQLINCYNIATNNEIQSRIRGFKAKLKQFSWQAGITVKFEHGDIFCGGARISREWILTSATCVKNAKHWHIVIGTIKRTNYSEGAFTTTGIQGIAHERFNSYLHNNLGLIKLAELPVYETVAMKPIALQARKDAEDNLILKNLTVSGWGLSFSVSGELYQEFLLYCHAEALLNEKCREIYGTNIVAYETVCLNNINGRSITEGDNGAPLVMYTEAGPILVGIASFISSESPEVSAKPTGFTRTGLYLDWIQKHTDIFIDND